MWLQVPGSRGPGHQLPVSKAALAHLEQASAQCGVLVRQQPARKRAPVSVGEAAQSAAACIPPKRNTPPHQRNTHRSTVSRPLSTLKQRTNQSLKNLPGRLACFTSHPPARHVRVGHLKEVKVGVQREADALLGQQRTAATAKGGRKGAGGRG
jgi:hypothetical protein